MTHSNDSCNGKNEHANREKIEIGVHPDVNVEIDPTLMSLLQKAFVWANEIGQKGKGVTSFIIREGSKEPFCHPRDAQHIIEARIFDPVNKPINKKGAEKNGTAPKSTKQRR